MRLDRPAPSSKRRILVLSKVLDLGGAERLLVDALPYLDREHFEYHFAYLMSKRDFLVPQFRACGFPVYCLGMHSNYHFPLMIPTLHGLQRRKGFDLLHAHLPLPGILARVIGRVNKKPVVYTEHNLLDHHHVLTRWGSRLTYGWNARVFAVSQGVAESIARAGLADKTQVVTLRNGVPIEQIRAEAADLDALRQELGIPGNHLIVGTVAVLSRQKRLHDWLSVARQVLADRQDVTFLLAGSGPEEPSLKAESQALGLADRVVMPGFRPDGRRVLGLADVYLMTSEFEGLPIALLEAMALGKPVVATCVGGIPEAIEDGREGFLAPVGGVDELARRTAQLLDDPSLRSEMGRRAAQRAEKEFHLKSRVRFVETVYCDLLGMPQPETGVV